MSSHLGARIGDGGENHTNHAWWQGKFYSKSGTDSRFLPFSACGFGKVQGLDGPNCRHSIGPGDGENNPFEQYDSEKNRKAYELQQRQQTMERRIRNTKRQVMNWKTAVDNAPDETTRQEMELQYQKKAALLQKQNKAYNEFCEENGLKRRSERIQIAKWDRQQAAKARVAAKKYHNGVDISKNRSIIKDRISAGEYNLEISKQQYLKHVEGTTQFDSYFASRVAKGNTPQGNIVVSAEEAQNLIKKYAGTGTPKVTLKGSVSNIEFVTADYVVGKYYKGGRWIDTKRFAIHYGKRSSHIVPVEEK